MVPGCFFVVPGLFSWFSWFFMVPGWFSWFFMVPDRFVMAFRGSSLVFHGSRSVFMAIMILGWFFMFFHGPRLGFLQNVPA